MNAAIILAGGKGERMSSAATPKQYLEVCGKPVFVYALEQFAKHPMISCITIVSAPEWRTFIDEWAIKLGVAIPVLYADPGETRQLSVLSALACLESQISEDDIVIIHDAARPLVRESIITECIEAVDGYDGVMPAIPVTDTVYQSKDGIRISATLNRAELYAGQTPECYRFGKYLAAHRKHSIERVAAINGSSEMAFLSGMNVRLCRGDVNNFKITTTADLERFAEIITRREFE